jgi:hypothetical protein
MTVTDDAEANFALAAFGKTDLRVIGERLAEIPRY